MRYKNLTIIGTSHIAKQSMEEVEAAIKKEKPSIVALELDKKRFYAITHDAKRRLRLGDIKRVGIKGFLFNVLGAWAENKLGKYVGVKPGAEMLKAIKLARETKARIALIDQDIEVTLAKVSKSFGWREKLNLVKDIIRGILFRKREFRKLGITELDLTKVPSKSLIKKLTSKFKADYPSLYRVLVEERNNVMAGNLRRIMDEHPDDRIVAIVGAGHEEEMIEIIKRPRAGYSFSVKVQQ